MTEICRQPDCDTPIMFVPNPYGRFVCLEVDPNPDGGYVINDEGEAVQLTPKVMAGAYVGQNRYICHTEKHPELRRPRG